MNASGSDVSAVSDRLHAAADELRGERRRIADELEAFEAFERRVRSIDTATGPPVPAGQPRTIAAETSSAGGGLGRVRDAYKATVMSVPHYDEDYGDTYRQSLAEEFAPDLAAALTEGTTFDERRKRAVLSAIAESKASRTSFLTDIDAERDSIEGAVETLSTVAVELEDLSAVPFAERSFGALDAYYSRLAVLEDKCETVSERRQATIFEQRRTRWLPAEVPDIAAYFYQDLDVEYPVMSAVAVLFGELADLRLSIERAMACCDD